MTIRPPAPVGTGARLLGLALLLLLPVLAAGQPESLGDAGLEPSYRLAVGDQIRVFVLGQPDLSVDVRVNDTGNIIYPLLGEVALEGVTREEAEELLYNKLKPDYLVEPSVSVTIISYRQIFLQGEVRRTGPFPYTPGMTLRRAILDAGGFTDLANENKIYVVNEFDTEGREQRIDLSYQLQPGDIVTVKASFF